MYRVETDGFLLSKRHSVLFEDSFRGWNRCHYFYRSLAMMGVVEGSKGTTDDFIRLH